MNSEIIRRAAKQAEEFRSQLLFGVDLDEPAMDALATEEWLSALASIELAVRFFRKASICQARFETQNQTAAASDNRAPSPSPLSEANMSRVRGILERDDREAMCLNDYRLLIDEIDRLKDERNS